MGIGESLAPFRGLLSPYFVLVYRLRSATRVGRKKDTLQDAARSVRELRNCLRPRIAAPRYRSRSGEDSREILTDRRFRDDIDRAALVDLVIGNVSAAANHQVILDQTLHDKYALRSHLFADEADIALQRKGLDAIKGSKPRILVIGATAGMIGALVARSFEVTATDMCPDLVGQKLGGVTVCEETENSRLIKTADLVIITGMTLPNRTLPALIEAAKTHNTSTVMWAITGKNFGHFTPSRA